MHWCLPAVRDSDAGMMNLSDNMRGAMMMSIAMVAFTLNDTFMKLLGDAYSLPQLLAMRGTIVTALMLGLAYKWGQLDLRQPRREWGLISLRTLAEIAAAYAFLPALFNMSLANVTAIMQSLPLALTLAGAVFLKEPVGWKRLVAIAIGFGGVMLIIQPGGDEFNIYSLLVIATVGFVVIRDLSARKLSRATPSLLVAAHAAGGVALSGYIMLPTVEWQPMGLREYLLLLGASGSVFVGYFLAVMAVRVGEIAFVSPFRYVSLISALILGLVIFNRIPNNLALVGSAIVVATGLFTLYREQLARRR